jgi:molecular chaperone GrpE
MSTPTPPSNGTSEDDLMAKIAAAQAEDQAQQTQAAATDAAGLQAKVDELTSALTRSLADFKNYKRRAEEDQAKFVAFANKELLLSLIPMVDNFERSVAHLPEDLKNNEWAKGILIIHAELKKSLDKMGVKKIETVGKPLDPKLHEALLSGPGEKNVILEEFEAGYTLNGEPLKPAKVKVGDGSK